MSFYFYIIYIFIFSLSIFIIINITYNLTAEKTKSVFEMRSCQRMDCVSLDSFLREVLSFIDSSLTTIKK